MWRGVHDGEVVEVVVVEGGLEIGSEDKDAILKLFGNDVECFMAENLAGIVLGSPVEASLAPIWYPYTFRMRVVWGWEGNWRAWQWMWPPVAGNVW